MTKTHPARTALAAGLACAALALNAAAQQSPGSPTANAPKAGAKSEAKSGSLAAADRDFVQKAAAGGTAEVELGKIAQKKAQDPKVKQFAERMVADHSKANDELKSIAGRKGAELPTEPDKRHLQVSRELERLSGARFDVAYMRQMVNDHKATVAEFEKASKGAKDGDLKAFASKTLPTLREHNQMAQETYNAARKAGKSAK